MDRRPRPRHGALLAPVFVLAACTSGDPDDPTSSSTASASASASPSPGAGVEITDAVSLGAAVRRGAAAVTTAAVELRAGGEDTSCTISGGATTSGGRLTGLRVDGPAGDAAVDVTFADNTAYVRAYDFDGPTTGPWHTVTAESTDPTVTAVRPCLVASYAVVSSAPLADALELGTGFEDTGAVPGGNRWSLGGFTPDAAGVLPSLLGGEVVPTQAFVDVDEQGRVMLVNALLSVDGTSYGARVTWSDFGTDVTVPTPAPSEIAD